MSEPRAAAPSRVEAAIVGGGPAGLGAAACLHARGIQAVVLEGSPRLGASWRRRYDGLRLNTVRWMSGLPGLRIPRSAGRWPSRDAYVDYLESYAARRRLDVRTGVVVEEVQREGGGYRLETSAGSLRARFVVIATGYDNAPRMPDWPGRESFAGELLHASRYRCPEPFRGCDVLVVGIGNTGSEIAVQLADGGAASVRVAMRTPPNLVRREAFGIPSTLIARISEAQPARLTDLGGRSLQRLLFGDLERYGIPRAPYGVATEMRVKGLGPVVDSGLVEALEEGRIEIVPAVERLDGPEVVLAGGARVRPDAVIAATGYRHGLERLVGHLGVLSPAGRPLVNGGRTHPNAPGLHFNGYWLPLRGQLPAMRATSRQIARAVARVRRREARTATGSAPRGRRAARFV